MFARLHQKGRGFGMTEILNRCLLDSGCGHYPIYFARTKGRYLLVSNGRLMTEAAN